jgi:hypothetical protein
VQVRTAIGSLKDALGTAGRGAAIHFQDFAVRPRPAGGIYMDFKKANRLDVHPGRYVGNAGNMAKYGAKYALKAAKGTAGLAVAGTALDYIAKGKALRDSDFLVDAGVDTGVAIASSTAGAAAAGAASAALAGALAGGTAGSVVPVAGTIAGMVVGAGVGLATAWGINEGLDSFQAREHLKDAADWLQERGGRAIDGVAEWLR